MQNNIQTLNTIFKSDVEYINENDIKFSEEELFNIEKIFLKRNKLYKKNDNLIYEYNNDILKFNLKTQLIKLNDINKEISIKKLPITKTVLKKLTQDIKLIKNNELIKKQILDL